MQHYEQFKPKKERKKNSVILRLNYSTFCFDSIKPFYEEAFMKQLTELYNEIEQEGIFISSTNFKKKKSGIITDGNNTVICVDYSKIADSKEEKVVLSEEKAHYDLGAFYQNNSNFYQIEKMEYKARKHSYNRLMPYAEMKKAIQKGIRTIYELSEYFGVPETDIAKAYYLYTNVENYAY